MKSPRCVQFSGFNIVFNPFLCHGKQFTYTFSGQKRLSLSHANQQHPNSNSNICQILWRIQKNWSRLRDFARIGVLLKFLKVDWFIFGRIYFIKVKFIKKKLISRNFFKQFFREIDFPWTFIDILAHFVLITS